MNANRNSFSCLFVKRLHGAEVLRCKVEIIQPTGTACNSHQDQQCLIGLAHVLGTPSSFVVEPKN